MQVRTGAHTVQLQPLSRLPPARQLRIDKVPKRRGVVSFFQVRQLVDDEVVQDIKWRPKGPGPWTVRTIPDGG